MAFFGMVVIYICTQNFFCSKKSNLKQKVNPVVNNYLGLILLTKIVKLFLEFAKAFPYMHLKFFSVIRFIILLTSKANERWFSEILGKIFSVTIYGGLQNGITFFFY